MDIRQSMAVPQTERRASTLLECRGYSTRRENPPRLNNSKKMVVEEEIEYLNTPELEEQ